VIVLICLFSHLGALGLVGPDEPRYAWIAREMASSGDWVTPRLYGNPWFEKPALFYWAAGLGFLLRLPPEWAVRLPSAFAALLSAVTIGWLAWRQRGAGNASLASPAILGTLLFSTSVAAIGFSRAAGPDMLFTASLTLAMAGAAAILFANGLLRDEGARAANSANPLLHLILFGASLGLAVLAKGPAGVILAGGAIGIWAICSASWRAAFRFLHPAAIVSFCLIAVPWYWLCASRNRNFLPVFILEHNFNRYLTPAFQHPQPYWFFVVMIGLGMLPWSGLLWSLVMDCRRSVHQGTWKTSFELFLACWALFPVLFFSFSKSKLPGYVLPSFPPLALLLASVLSQPSEAKGETNREWSVVLGLTWIIFGVSTKFWLRRLPDAARAELSRPILFLAVLVVILGLVILALGFSRRRGALAITLVAVAAIVEFSGLRILPALDPSLSAKSYGQMLAQDRHPDRVFTYRLSRSWLYGLGFYLHREVREWSSEDPEAALLLTTPQGAAELETLGRFQGPIESAPSGILFVPVLPRSR
jgi:4-amino-4-deoxy-L-arabinose transferase-like glycosyltransferase